LNKNALGIIGAGYWATNIIKTLEEMNIKNIYLEINLNIQNILEAAQKKLQK